GNILYVTDAAGNFLRDDNGNLIKARVISPADEIQGIFGDINYGVPPQNMAGMDIADYDTTAYRNAIPSVTVSVAGSHVANGIIATTGSGVTTVTEYFPHAAGSFTTPASSTSQMLTRRRYVNKTFTNVRIPANSNALFENCTFNGVLYIDTGQTGTSNFNNIRFHNCTFNGTIVTNTPQSFNWQRNALYFTGGSTFQNQTNTEATILAPHFNVNLGNTNPVAGTNNVLRGAIIGGIVDIRGNAEVFGTIISMADTSANTSGFVTNIGATLNDGGSETVAISDVGTINITPDAENRLPSGILTPIVIRPDQSTYAEVL
ncbi:MAG TPA: hypothetical protein VLH60_04300, partial [Sedimentisphaerales bacterium]|nr:hypothetical protein [Sedimentisphaerales bacterium]